MGHGSRSMQRVQSVAQEQKEEKERMPEHPFLP